MGSLRNLKKDSEKKPPKAKPVSNYMSDGSFTTTSSSYTGVSTTTLTFGDDFNGYGFNVVNLTINSRSNIPHQHYNSYRSKPPTYSIGGYLQEIVITIEELINKNTPNLWSWMHPVVPGSPYKKDGILELKDHTKTYYKTWEVLGCFPIKMNIRNESCGVFIIADITCDKYVVK